jgi:hypothetical protein
MARPKKTADKSVERVNEKKTECVIKSNDRYKVEPIDGINNMVSVKDTKYDVIFEYNLADKTSKVRPLKDINSGILKQAILDFDVFVMDKK